MTMKEHIYFSYILNDITDCQMAIKNRHTKSDITGTIRNHEIWDKICNAYMYNALNGSIEIKLHPLQTIR